MSDIPLLAVRQYSEKADPADIGCARRFINYLTEAGFYKQGEVSFPHKQSAVMKIDRESWEAPAL